ncbi:MAG: glycoside hydrolase family 95-like protein [Mangrovibacterium sp.]
MMPKSRRNFLRIGAITIGGLTIAPKFIRGEQIERIITHDEICNPERYNMQLSPDPIDGFLLQNDIVGVRLWGPVTQPTLSIGKSDIWDRRWLTDKQPLITLSQIKELAATNRLAEIAPAPNTPIYRLYKNDFPCPKTGGQIILGVPFATDTRFRANEDGSIQMLITGQNKRLKINIWVTLMHPVIVMECLPEGIETGDFWLRTYRHQDTIKPGGKVNPTAGDFIVPEWAEQLAVPDTYEKNGCWGITQKFIPDSTFPEGFEFSLLSTCIETDPEIEQQDNRHNLGTPLWAEKEGRFTVMVYKRYTPINEAPGSATTAYFKSIPKQFTILSAIETTQDTGGHITKTVESLIEMKKEGINVLHDEQRKAIQQGKRKDLAKARVRNMTLAASSFVFPNIRKKGGYYGDIPICSVDTTKFCYQDSSPWHADFHFNELRAEPLLILGQFEDVYLYCELIHTMLPGAQENAKDVYGLPGAMYPLAHFPLRCSRGVTHVNPTWEQDMGMNGLICKPLWLYYRYTGDINLLKKLAYPVLRECSRFMMAYLSESDDGFLHIIPTVSPEHWGLTANFERNKDCTSALTMTRYLLRSSAKAARVLGIDAPEAETWEAAAEKLADFPIFQTESGPIWVDVAGAHPIQYNTPVPLSPVFWGDEIGLDSPSEEIAIARRTLEHIDIVDFKQSYLNGCIRPRLGIWFPKSSISGENMLQSYQSIHIFPCVPPEGEIAMENFAAEGGFRISAKRTSEGKIHDVQVKSNLGGICRISSPWEKIKVYARNTEVSFLTEGKNIIRFDTIKDEVYDLKEVI